MACARGDGRGARTELGRQRRLPLPGAPDSSGNTAGFVSVGVPVINDVNGFQVEPSWRLLTGIAVSF